MRSSEIQRKTAETNITLRLNLDGKGTSDIDTGIGFLNHMLTLFAKHGRFDLDIHCVGDTDVDDHHSTEDIGIALGNAFAQALGEKRGINRYGNIILPMDEALVLVAVDISGRSCLRFDVPVSAQKVGTFDTELVQEFFEAFARSASVTLHIRKLDGMNTHHIIEAVYKAFGRTMRQAVTIDASAVNDIPSTKGVL